MKVYHLTKQTEPMFMVSTYYPEAVLDILTKYIPLKETSEALAYNTDSQMQPDDYVNLLMCTESGCEFTLLEQEMPDEVIAKYKPL